MLTRPGKLFDVNLGSPAAPGDLQGLGIRAERTGSEFEPSSKPALPRGVLRAAILVCMAVILVVDVVTPADDVSICFVYTVPIAFSILGVRRSPYVYAATATVLSLLGSAIQPPTDELLVVFLGNRAIAIAAQWAIAALVVDHLRTQRRTLLELEHQQRKVESSQRFLSILSHEIATSLTAIDGQAFRMGRLSGSLSPTDITHRVQRIRRAVDRIRDLAERIQLASDAGEGSITPRPAPVDLSELIRETVQGASEPVGRQIRLVMDGDPIVIDGDRQMLAQVFDNLLSNALKYSPEDSPIEVRAEKRAGLAIVSVRDRGGGIPPHDQAKLFQPYFRGTNSHGTPGLGIGLYIAERFVAAHGGTIQIDTSTPEGTGISVRLPAES